MNFKSRICFTLLTVFMVFSYSAMNTIPALADDGVPPVDVATNASEPQPTVDSATEEAIASESVATEEPTTDVFAQLPEGTDLVVLDESGESVPLVTEEAAETLVNGDPIWCPNGVAPKASTGGCSPSFTGFNNDGSLDNGLIAWLNDPLNATAVSKAGTIWVAYNYVAVGGEGGGIVIDGASVAGTMDNFALTIQGGWNGTPLSKLLDTTNPYSTFDSTFTITGWTGSITINNIISDGVTTNTAADNTALSVATKGNIILNNVTVNSSVNSNVGFETTGTSLDNTSGVGTVTINNSDFSDNEGDGLVVNTKGTIAVNGLVASFNGGSGATFTNNTVQGKSVTLKGFKQFNNNGVNGLVVISAGAITLNNVVANNNDGNGIYLDNTDSTANLGITLGGTNFTMNNGLDGTAVYSHGVITANNLNSSSNDGAGAILDNCDFNGTDCNVIYAKTIKLTGINVFNGNGTSSEGGLTIRSFGAISVSYLTASDNLGDGAYIDNQLTNFNGIDSVGTWILTGYGFFLNNSGDGLAGYSFGSMSLVNIDASKNNGDGVYLDSEKATGGSNITLSGINLFEENVNSGLSLVANGAITLYNITANFNGSVGTYVDNLYNPIKPYNVILKGTNTFKENGDEGLVVVSFGTILVYNLTANDNGGDAGAVLDNCIYTSSCTTPTAKTITVMGYINTSNNTSDGLYIDSTGAITLTNIVAESNGGAGVYILNDAYLTKAQTVTLKGSNTFNYNVSSGLEVYSFGVITANNITAFDNGASGAVLVNSGGVPAKGITLTGVNAFIGNYLDGLSFDSDGSVVLYSVNAEGNGWDVDPGNGITGVAGGSITLVCAQTTNQVNGAGYDLTAGTTITIKGIYSNWNNTADVRNAFSTVTITKPCTLP